MMMNPILGIEPTAGGKAPPAPARIQNKTNNSNDFSDFLAAEAGRETVTGDPSSTDSESAVPKAETEDSVSLSVAAGENGNAAGADATTEETVLPESAVEAEPDVSLLGQEAVETAGTDESELDGTTQVKTGGQGTGGSAKQSIDGADADEDASVKEAADVTGAQEIPKTTALPASEPESGTQGMPLDRSKTPAESGLPKKSMFGDTSKLASPAGTVGGQGNERVGTNEQGAQRQPLQATPETVSESAVAAPEAEAGKRSATGAGASTKPEFAGQAALGSKGSVSAAMSTKAPGAGTTVSGFPNEKAVEQIVSRQPEGVTRAIAAGTQGAVQVLAAGQPASREGAGKAELGTVSVTVPEEDSAKDFAAGKSGSGAVRNGDFQAAQIPQAAQQGAAMFQPLLAAGLAEAAGEANPISQALGLTGEAPGLSQLLTEASIGTQAAHRPEMPRMIAAQIAEAFAAKGEQKVEVSLNPQELGHVKMRVVTSETGITMIIQTERPETGDLMRRHINELAEEFRRMGYEDISFEFSGGQTGSGGTGDGGEDGTGQAGSMANSQTGTEPVAEQATQNLRLGTAGVDMRV